MVSSEFVSVASRVCHRERSESRVARALRTPLDASSLSIGHGKLTHSLRAWRAPTFSIHRSCGPQPRLSLLVAPSRYRSLSTAEHTNTLPRVAHHLAALEHTSAASLPGHRLHQSTPPTSTQAGRQARQRPALLGGATHRPAARLGVPSPSALGTRVTAVEPPRPAKSQATESTPWEERHGGPHESKRMYRARGEQAGSRARTSWKARRLGTCSRSCKGRWGILAPVERLIGSLTPRATQVLFEAGSCEYLISLWVRVSASSPNQSGDSAMYNRSMPVGAE